MKELLMVVSLLLSGVVAEGPYPPSGWRPDGPSFDLPARPQNPEKQEYLPPVDPRRPAIPTDSGDDVSVQGLPTVEQQPIFQVSPINGQQYAGPTYQADLRSLDQTLQQIQYLQQLEKQREFAKQRQLDTARANNAANGLQNPQPPRRFVPQATSTTTSTTTQKPEISTELNLNEGEDYDADKDAEKASEKTKVSVEVTKQNIQEYPPELFLAPLTQFKVHPQFLQIQQLGQLRAPLIYQPQQLEQQTQKAEGFSGPAHFAALPSVLAQQQLLAQAQPVPQPQYSQSPAVVFARNQDQPAYLVPQEQLTQYQPAINTQYQPQAQVQAFPQIQAQPVILPPQSNQLQPQYPQPAQREPEAEDVENIDQQGQQRPQLTPQFVYQGYQPQEVYRQPMQPIASQYQPQAQQPFPVQPLVAGQYQPQAQQSFPQPEVQYQPQQVYKQQYPAQPEVASQYQPEQIYQQQFPAQTEVASQYQPQQVYQQYPSQFQSQNQQNLLAPQPQLINYPAQDWNQYYQQQLYQQFVDSNAQQILQGQDSLQSGLDVNQDGNGIDKKEKTDDEEEQNEDGSRATAVATAFGARTQPRVFSQYGTPAATRPQAYPGYTTTEAPQEEVTDDSPSVAQATAVATGSRKSAKLRSRRVRPVFTLDRSGHLVLAQDQ